MSALLLPACDDGGGGDDGAVETDGLTTATSDGSTGGAVDPTAGQPTGATTSDDPSTTGAPATTGAEETTGDVETTGDTETSSGESSGGDVPTSGPGVLPGETGQEAMCRRALECGGTYFPTAEECIDSGTDYWGSCPDVQAALDAFGACMAGLACDEYNPDGYIPGNTPCGDLYGDLQDVGPC
ncbi:MAG: hypothetical protein AAGA54_12955 [Myxococcota bacterium]